MTALSTIGAHALTVIAAVTICIGLAALDRWLCARRDAAERERGKRALATFYERLRASQSEFP